MSMSDTSNSVISIGLCEMSQRKEMFYLTNHSTHFIYGYMAKDHSDSERGFLKTLDGRVMKPLTNNDS